MTTQTKKTLIKAIVAGLIAALTIIGSAVGLTSCHAVRNVTTTAETYQKGDTSVIIQTKTIESYTATKN